MIHLILIILSFSPLSNNAETTISPIVIDTQTYVNCGHAERLLQVDPTQYGIGEILAACWHRGVTLDELAYGIATMTDLREDIENYGFAELYVPCEDVFAANLTRLTTSLLEDYVNCVERDAVNDDLKAQIDERFDDIIQAYKDGNSSVTVDEQTLVSCGNASKRVSLLCRAYGLTGDQWSRGFLRYHYNDKWAVEEEVGELSLGCDRIFNAKLQEDVYEDVIDAFVKCQATLGVDSEVRDGTEKRYAKELMEYRGGASSDLRGYVSCRHLIPINVRNGAFSASWYAYDQCRAKGLTYRQLCNGMTTRDNESDALSSDDENFRDMYVKCENVFNNELWSFTTGLINDYRACNEVGKIDKKDRIALEKKFAKLFELLATKRPKMKVKTIAEDLISCSGLTNALADECRRHGTTISQELRGIGSLAHILGDKWLNTEPLDKLYIRCDDVFDKYITYLDDVPLEKFIQCRWNEGMSDDGLAYVKMRIADEYKNELKSNDTRFIGDADVEISSTILFTEEHRLEMNGTEPSTEPQTE